MANDYVKNFVYGLVSVAPSPATTGTSLSLSDADAAEFPDPATTGIGAYDVVVWPAGTKPLSSNAEIVRITAKASPSGGNTAFTITRIQQSTSARTIIVGDQMALNLTAKTITDIISMGTSSNARGEVPGGAVNSSNTAYTTAAAFQTGSLRVYHNGIRLKGGAVDFTEGTQGFTMVTAPITGDVLLVDYETNTSSFSTGSTSFVYEETPSGTVNGSNTSFTIANTPVSGTFILYRDGQRIAGGGADYTLSGTTVTFVTAPVTGSVLRCDYQLSLSVAGNADTLDGYHANATPTVGQVPVLDSNMAMIGEGLGKQIIRNGNFEVSQVATTFVAGANNDDVYTLDGWNLISDGNDTFDVSQEAITDLPGSNYALKLDVETSKRGGVVQFIEAKDAQKLKGKVVSLSFAVKSANIAAIRATVLSWSSTADSVTSDVVTTWGATPTWAANWADNATPADLTVTSSWTTVKIENIAIDEATVNNLALAIWLPNEETIGDIVYISQVKMNLGDKALPFNPRAYEEELKKCQRFCFVPETSQIVATLGLGFAYSTTIAFVPLKYPVKMRVIPTLTATAGDWQLGDFGAAYDLIAIDNTTDAVRQTADAAILRCTVASGLTANRPYVLQCDSAANRIMIFRSEL